MTSTIDSTDALTGRESPSGGIQVRRATGSVGAIVTGVDLNDDFDEATGAVVRDALQENCVLVVRGQFLTPDAHMRVARLWGEPYLPHYYQANSVEGYPHIAVVPNFGKERTPSEGWHVDGSHFRVPPTVSIAVGRTIPAVGGDTMFSNQYNAYDRLSDGMKEFLEGRRVRFVGTRPVGPTRRMDVISDLLPSNQKEEVAHYHLIAPRHPATGRKALYLNRPGEAMTQFEGMTEAESLPILEFLHAQSVTADNVYRHQWTPGDLVAWDNRCAMHYGVHDYGDVERTLVRITVDGAI